MSAPKPFPPDSKIIIEEKPQGTYIRLPQLPQHQGAVRLIVFAYFGLGLFWLVGLLYTWDIRHWPFFVALLIFGGMHFFMLGRLLRRPMPERWVLTEQGFHFDEGVPPLNITNWITPWSEPLWWGKRYIVIDWREVFQRRRRLYVERKNLHFHLRYWLSNNQLFLSYNNTQLELAKGVSALEREWLLKFLEAHYHV